VNQRLANPSTARRGKGKNAQQGSAYPSPRKKGRNRKREKGWLRVGKGEGKRRPLILQKKKGEINGGGGGIKR